MSNLIFGCWPGGWGWRVEWVEHGLPHYKDFYQRELQPGKDKIDAEVFKAALLKNELAA